MKKKTLSMLFAVLMAFSLTACVGNSEQQEETGMEAEADRDMDALTQGDDMPTNVTDDGFEIVDEINVDTDEIAVKYTGYEIVDDTDENNNPVRRLIAYFDFTNKTSTPLSSGYALQTSAYQSGIELQGWGGSGSYLNESLENEMVEIRDNATLNIAFLYDIQDEENPITFRLSNSILCDEITIEFGQEQEIALK